MNKLLLSTFLIFTFFISNPFAADSLAYSLNPPNNLLPEEVPMFVCFGWDDNGFTDGVYWSDSLFLGVKNPDGTDALGTYFLVGGLGAGKPDVIESWQHLRDRGHEIACHTWSHSDALKTMDKAGWSREIDTTNKFLSENLGVPLDSILGFRTPKLAFSAATFEAIVENNMLYECTLEFGYDWWTVPGNDQGFGTTNPETGKNYWWPFTMDNGIPPGAHNSGNAVGKIKGLWEVHVYTYNDPNAGYSIDINSDPNTVTMFTGFDYNHWKKGHSPESFGRVLKYSLLQRLQGNRCPFTVNVHSDEYSIHCDDSEFAEKDDIARRIALTDFMEFAKSFKDDVYFVPYIRMIGWMQNPKTLSQMLEGTSNTIPQSFKNRKISISNISNNKLSCSVVKEGNYQFSLYNMIGQKVIFTNKKLSAGNNKILINHSLPSGRYAVTLKGNGDMYSKIVEIK